MFVKSVYAVATLLFQETEILCAPTCRTKPLVNKALKDVISLQTFSDLMNMNITLFLLMKKAGEKVDHSFYGWIILNKMFELFTFVVFHLY